MIKTLNEETYEYEDISLEELHRRVHNSIDRSDNFNYGEYEDLEKPTNDYDIEDFTENPYDYGSHEYLTTMEKLKAQRDKYRESKENSKNLYLQNCKKYSR